MNYVKVLKSKLHGATVTDANIEYEGSITLDASLMEMAGIHNYEAVHIWNITTGTRLETYALPEKPGSGIVCINGAAALHNKKGDKIIIATFKLIPEEEANRHQPKVIFLDKMNKPQKK